MSTGPDLSALILDINILGLGSCFLREIEIFILASTDADSVNVQDVQPMVFFLTDGHPTVGVTDTLQILDNIKTANSRIGAPLFSLAFGRRTDFQMLRQGGIIYATL